MGVDPILLDERVYLHDERYSRGCKATITKVPQRREAIYNLSSFRQVIKQVIKSRNREMYLGRSNNILRLVVLCRFSG